jgi:hypothetical protein
LQELTIELRDGLWGCSCRNEVAGNKLSNHTHTRSCRIAVGLANLHMSLQVSTSSCNIFRLVARFFCWKYLNELRDVVFLVATQLQTVCAQCAGAKAIFAVAEASF